MRHIHLEDLFPPIIWIFTEGEGDGIQSRLSFQIFSTLPITILVIKHHNRVKVVLKLHLNFYTPMIPQDIYATSHNTACASRVLKYQKSLISIGQRLSWLLDERIAKMCKRFFSQRRFVIILIICFEMHMDRPDRSISLLFLIISILIIIHFCCYMSWLISH